MFGRVHLMLGRGNLVSWRVLERLHLGLMRVHAVLGRVHLVLSVMDLVLGVVNPVQAEGAPSAGQGAPRRALPTIRRSHRLCPDVRVSRGTQSYFDYENFQPFQKNYAEPNHTFSFMQYI